MIEKECYFEVGRGAKLIPHEYWHQYVLAIDISREIDFLVVSEIGKDKVLFKQNINLEEIRKARWSELLTISRTQSFIDELILHDQDKVKQRFILHKVATHIKENRKRLNGNWTSIAEYHDLNYNSNFGNWVDASPIKGKLKFTLILEKKNQKNCRVDIPVVYWTLGDGYYSIKFGEFQLTRNQILIWGDTIFPSQIDYSLKDNILTLMLFQRQIKFQRD